MSSPTWQGASITMLLVVLMMYSGLMDVVRVWTEEVTAVNREVRWLDVDEHPLNLKEFKMAFGFPWNDTELADADGAWFVNAVTKSVNGKEKKKIKLESCSKKPKKWDNGRKKRASYNYKCIDLSGYELRGDYNSYNFSYIEFGLETC